MWTINDREEAPTNTKRAMTIAGINISVVSMQDAVTRIVASSERSRAKPLVVTAVNAHFIVTAQRDSRLRSFLNNADLCVPDGCSILLSARLFGCVLRERITGIDLMIGICEAAAQQQKSVYFIGGRPGAADGAAHFLKTRFPTLRIAGVDRPPLGREFEREEAEQMRRRIRAAEPDFLFVCFGVPLQEYWIENFALDLPVGMVMGNGAAFDVLAGHFVRPPLWVQRIGMEWLARLIAEPRRLWRRYVFGNTHFVGLIVRQAIFGK